MKLTDEERSFLRKMHDEFNAPSIPEDFPGWRCWANTLYEIIDHLTAEPEREDSHEQT